MTLLMTISTSLLRGSKSGRLPMYIRDATNHPRPMGAYLFRFNGLGVVLVPTTSDQICDQAIRQTAPTQGAV